MALISTKVKELHTFLYDAGLTDLTESVFREEFEDVRFQDEVFLKMTSTDPPAYRGSKEQFIANYVVTSEDRLPEKLSTSQISIYDQDGVEQTLKRRSDKIAQSRDVTNAINGLRTTLSDMSTNSAFSDRAKEAASGLSVTGSGDLYNIIDANGATVSTIDYSGFTSYSERSNILNNALTDVSDYLQQFDIDAYKDLMGGSGLNYSYVGPNSRRVRLKKAGDFELTELPPPPAKGTRLSKAGDFELTTVLDVAEEQEKREEEGTSLVAAPTMTGAITAEDISHYNSRFGSLGANGFKNVQLAKGPVSFEYADIVLNKGGFNLNERIEEINKAGGTEVTINGQVYNIENVKAQGEAGGNVSLVLVGKPKLTEDEQQQLENIQIELGIAESNLELYRDSDDYDFVKRQEDYYYSLKEKEDRLLNKAEAESQTIRLDQLGSIQQFATGSNSISENKTVSGSVNRVLENTREIINNSTPEGVSEFSQEVTAKVLEQVNALPEDAEMTMTLYENGETVTRKAESKAEYSDYLISRYFNEGYKGLEEVEELKDVTASVEAGTYIRINGTDYDMNPFDQQSFLLEDADYMLSDLLTTLTSKDGKGATLFTPTDVKSSDLETIRSITDYEELNTISKFIGNKGQAVDFYADQQEEIEKIQKNLGTYYEYYANLYQLSMLNGDAASAAKAKEYADQIERVSTNMFSSDKFEAYKFVTDYLDSEKKRIENSNWAVRTLYNSAATVTNSASNLVESAFNFAAGAAGIVGADDFSESMYSLSEDMDQFYNTYADFSKTSKFQGADMGGGDYVEYEGYRVYVDGDGNPTKVYTEDLQHVGEFDKTEVINKISEDASFQDRTVKSSNWWSGASATGYVGAAMGSITDLYFAGRGTKMLMSAGRIARVARPLTSKLPKASFLSAEKAQMVKQRVGQASVFTGMMYNDIKNEAIASGFTEEEASRYSWAVSASIGLVNAAIFPGTEQFFGGLTNTTSRTAILAASKKIGTDKITAAGMKKAAEVTLGTQLRAAGKGFVVEGAKETLEEVVFENAAQMLYHNYAAKLSENEVEAYKVTMDDARNTAIISFAIGGAAGGMNAKSEISNINNMARMDFDDLMFDIAKKPSSAKREIQRLQKKGVITSDVAAELTTNLEYAERSVNNMSSKLREKSYISAVYRAEMRAQRLDAEASSETNESVKEYKTNQAKAQRELAQALTVAESARRTGDAAYILNGKVVSRTEMDNFFANKDASSPLLANATYEVINDNELSASIESRFDEQVGKAKSDDIKTALSIQKRQTSTLKISQNEERKQRKKDRENQRNARRATVEGANQDIEVNQERIDRFENSRQEDGSFVFDSKPEDGIKYTEREVDGKTQYVVSKREGEKFIRNTKSEISKQEEFVEYNEYVQNLEDSVEEGKVDLGDLSAIEEIIAASSDRIDFIKSKAVKNRKGNYEFTEEADLIYLNMPYTKRTKGIFSRRTVYEVSKEDFESYKGSPKDIAFKKVLDGNIKGLTNKEFANVIRYLRQSGQAELADRIVKARVESVGGEVAETAPVKKTAPARSRMARLESVEGDIADSEYNLEGNSDLINERRPTNDKGVAYDDNGVNSGRDRFEEKFGVDSPNMGDPRGLAREKAQDAGVGQIGNIGKVVSRIHKVGGQRFLQLAFNADEYGRRPGSAGGIMIKIPNGADVKLFERIHKKAFQRAIDKNIGTAANNESPVDYSIYDFFMNEGAIVSDMNTAKADIIAKMKQSLASKAEAAPVEQDVPVEQDAAVEQEGDIEEGSVEDALLSRNLFERDGVIGELKLEGDAVVFESVENGVTQKTEVGNINELIDTNLDELGISKASIEVSENGSATVQGESYTNNYSDINSAITLDENGDVESVTLTDENGENKTFTGNVAEEIAYQYALLDLKKLSDQQIDAVTQRLRQRVADAKKKRKVDARLAKKAKRRGGKVVKARKIERKETATQEDAEPVTETTPAEEDAPVAKAEPKKKPTKKKAEPKREEEPVVDTEDIAKFREERQKILDSERSLAGKKTALSALVRRYAKRLNLVGQDAGYVDRIRRARSEGVMAKATQEFADKAAKRAQKPGDSKIVNTAVELKKKLREINSAIRKTKLSVNKKMQEVTKGVKQTLKDAGINSESKVYKQILNRLATLNINSPKSLLRFEMYVDKVVGDAKFEQKLKEANIIRKRAKRLAKGSSISPNLTDAAKEYSKLDPLMVENIDAHIELGKKIVEGLQNVKVNKQGDVVIPKVFNKVEVENYVKTEKSRQEDINAEETKIILEALGIDTSNLTNAQAKEILDAQKEVKETGKDKTNDFIDKVSRAFNQYKANLMAEAKKRGLSKSQMEAVKRFSEVDLTILNNDNKRETVTKAMNIMNNFYENGDIAGMDAISLAYEGAKNVQADVKRGVSGRRSTMIGRVYGSVVNQLAMEFERVFGGQNEGFKILEASGVNKLISGAASARTIVNNYFNEYNKLRKNKYQTADNTFERGIYAFVARVDSGVDPAEAFKRRKGLVEQSLEKYKNTDEKTYKVLQKVYDKILKDSNSFQEVEAKMDAENIKLVNFYRSKFSENFSEFQEMNLSLRNKKLDADQNYFPDLYFSTEGVKVQVAAKFHKLNYDSEASAGIEAERPYKLPKDRNINFNFDEVAYNKMNEMMVDTKTAAALAQIDAYMNSPEFETIAGNETNAARLRGRVNGYRENVKGDNHYVSAIEKDAQTAIMRYLDPLFKFGYAKALFSTMQPVKQATSALVITLFQAPRMLMNPDSAKTFVPGSAINKAINRSGMAIANRGADTRYEDNTEEKVALQLSKSRSAASKVWLALGVPSEVALKVSVGAADSAAARASFVAFYKKRLKKMGLPHKNIDWANHQWNEEAASYADMMVSRNQAPSDTRLRGKLFTAKGMGYSLARKTILPFSNFIMAQKARMYSDVRALTNSRTTREDRIAASGSLAGTAAEMAAYHAIGYAVGRVIMNKVAEVLGYEEEKDGEMVDFLGYAIPKKDFDQFMAYRGSTMFADIFSPIPIADSYVKVVANYLIEETTGKEDFIKIWDSENQITDYLGTAGIAVEGFMEMYDTYNLYTTGEYEYEDAYGNKSIKKISPESQSILKDLYIYQGLAAFGLIPVDAERYVSKVKSYAKKMGPDHKFSDAYIEQLYGEVMEKHDLTVDQMKQYVSYSVDDNGRRSGEWDPSIKYDDKTKEYLRIHNREKYLLYEDIDKAMKAAEKERVDSRTIERALEYFTIKQLYVLKENEPEQYEVIKDLYKITDTQVDDRMQALIDVEDEIIMRMQARNQTSR